MHRKENASGRLYVVAVHIGNVEDLSVRAVRILQTVDRIACESVAHTKILLDKLGIPFNRSMLIVLNDINESKQSKQILDLVSQGSDVAIVTDSGTPLISDPGFTVIRRAFKRGQTIVPIPGPSSLTTIASVCPIPLNTFQFIGFVRPSGLEKRKHLMSIAESTVSSIFFETAKRIQSTLSTLIELGFGERELFLGRELTKIHEELLHGSVDELYSQLNSRTTQLGEFVGVLAKNETVSARLDSDGLIRELLPHVKASKVAAIVSRLTPMKREDAYSRTVELQELLDRTKKVD
ncbi:MAG: rRNA small subunit methyltransferase 1 [Gammaproteobacteria bacterium]|nr:rRNA small subunit methyltransferase 1 [Gammaproteobacteria bacterium]